jgi:Leucine-rich repeat (LRR) protein
MSCLLINLSLPQVQVIIDQMPLYRGIKTLIVTTEKPVSNVDLDKILDNAKDYPLEDLYIINFGPTLTTLPPEVSNFPDLKILGIYNNGLTSLPASVSKLTGLSTLQIQDNPISTVLPTVNSLKNLKELGVAMTKISGNEIGQIRKTLPECKITTE